MKRFLIGARGTARARRDARAFEQALRNADPALRRDLTAAWIRQNPN
jgi:hypothetical protein